MTPTQITERIESDCANLVKAFVDARQFRAAYEVLGLVASFTPENRVDLHHEAATLEKVNAALSNHEAG